MAKSKKIEENQQFLLDFLEDDFQELETDLGDVELVLNTLKNPSEKASDSIKMGQIIYTPKGRFMVVDGSKDSVEGTYVIHMGEDRIRVKGLHGWCKDSHISCFKRFLSKNKEAMEDDLADASMWQPMKNFKISTKLDEGTKAEIKSQFGRKKD